MASQTHPTTLISSEDVEGTDVYSTQDSQKIGEIHHLMIDKKSGNIAYAVMSFGGFLGMGENYHPIPWNALKYDLELDGYVTGITEAQLKDAPFHDDRSYHDRAWESRVHEHYGAPYYWGLMV